MMLDWIPLGAARTTHPDLRDPQLSSICPRRSRPVRPAVRPGRLPCNADVLGRDCEYDYSVTVAE